MSSPGLARRAASGWSAFRGCRSWVEAEPDGGKTEEDQRETDAAHQRRSADGRGLGRGVRGGKEAAGDFGPRQFRLAGCDEPRGPVAFQLVQLVAIDGDIVPHGGGRPKRGRPAEAATSEGAGLRPGVKADTMIQKSIPLNYYAALPIPTSKTGHTEI